MTWSGRTLRPERNTLGHRTSIVRRILKRCKQETKDLTISFEI